MVLVAYNEKIAMGDGEFISLNKSKEFVNMVAGDGAEFVRSRPITRDELILAHAPQFVDSILSLNEDNGFSNCRPDVLEQVLNANGAMLTAALLAVEKKTAVCAPVSGFHHAGYDYNGPYCTFNGLMVAACALKKAGLINKVLILDLDGHLGDGTQDIIGRLSAHHWVDHHTHGGTLSRTSGDQTNDKLFKVLMATDADLVLYQAGADSYAKDPYGVGYFTLPQYIRRDTVVFTLCKSRNIPIAWNLAGGYDGGMTAMLHYSTFAAANVVYEGVGHTND